MFSLSALAFSSRFSFISRALSFLAVANWMLSSAIFSIRSDFSNLSESSDTALATVITLPMCPSISVILPLLWEFCLWYLNCTTGGAFLEETGKWRKGHANRI